MNWEIYEKEIKEIIDSKSEVSIEPKMINLSRPEFLGYPERTKFYEENDNIKTFNTKFDDFISDFPLELPALCFYDKFRIYKLFYPDYKVWSMATVIPGKEGIAIPNTDASDVMYGFCKYSVSTDGDVWSHGLTKKGEKLRNPAPTKQGYLRGLFGINKSLLIHRVVLCTFTNDLSYKGYAKSTLTANHKNAIRDDNKLLNLEWMTHMENIMDMSLNDRCEHSSQPIKGTTTIDLGIPIGTVFYLRRRSDIREYGVNLKSFGTRLGKCTEVFGCSWEDYSIEEIEEDKLGIPKEVQSWISYRQNTNTSPLKIELLEDKGIYKRGTIFYLTKFTMIREVVNRQFTGWDLNSGCVKMGCHWVYQPSIINMENTDQKTLDFLKILLKR